MIRFWQVLCHLMLPSHWLVAAVLLSATVLLTRRCPVGCVRGRLKTSAQQNQDLCVSVRHCTHKGLFALLSFPTAFYHENECFMATKEPRNSRSTHTQRRQCFCHSSLECAEPLLCKWANMGPCKPLCVHCKDLSYHLRGCRKDVERTRVWAKRRHMQINILDFYIAEWACGVLIAFSIHEKCPFNHWDSLHFHLNLFHKEQIQFGSCFPAQGRKTESFLVPEGTI